MDSIVNSMPKITVLMPVYNCELYIREAIDSILNQTLTDFEFLIIDDASTDKTVEVIKTYNEGRIKLVVKPSNTGYTNSLNYGLQVAKGEYIARMDGDDISFSERFAKQVAFLDANPDVVLCGSWFSIIDSGTVKKLPENNEAIKLALLRGNCIAHPSVMMRKQILNELSVVYDVSKEPAEDYDLWVRLLSLGKLHNLQEALLNYRMHSTQVSHKRAEEQKKRVIETKFELINLLGIVWDAGEHKVFEKIFKENTIINFSEIKIFKQMQRKLFLSNNSNCFFESNGFKQYLSELEYIVLKKCFYRQKRHSPLMYLEYLLAKCKWNVKLSTEQEIKLGIKSMLFWKVTKM